MFETNPLEKIVKFAMKTGCSSGNQTETISCLKSMTMKDLMEQLTLDLSFPPVVDGEFIEMHPKEVFLNKNGIAGDILDIYRKYDIIFGLNSDEGALYLVQ